MVPRFLISAPKGMSGKTIVTLGVIYGLAKRGLRVAPFKVGPDFIDPTYHSWASGRPGRNLDPVLMGEEGVLERFIKYTVDVDIAVIEGVLGLYDSPDGVSEVGSTAQVAKLLKAPVVLVLNGDRVNRTLRAVVRGLKSFDPGVKIAGVVLTNVTSKQAEKITKSLSEEGVEVFGAVPKSSALERAFEYRHLGLVPVGERADAPTLADVLENYVVPYLDLDRFIDIARSAEPDGDFKQISEVTAAPGRRCKVGIVKDNAFTFYYPELIEEATFLGEPIFLNALEGDFVDEVDLVIVGGGFPEVYAERLEKNKSFRKSLLEYIQRGGRVYAECGGLMYLTSSIVIDRNEYEMVGAIDAVTVLLRRPVGKGYVWGSVVRNTPVAPVGTKLLGHEFHYSKLIPRERLEPVIKLERGVGIGGGWDGVVKWNMHAQYMHIHPYTYNVLRYLCQYM